MDDKERIALKIVSLKRRTRIFLYLGYILLGIGVCILSRSKEVGFTVIAVGVIFRVFYYIGHYNLKSLKSLHGKLNVIMLFFTLFITSFPLKALETGQRVSEFKGLEFLKGDEVKIFNSEGKVDNILVVELWAPWDKGSTLSFKLLSALQKEFSKDDVIFIGISKDDIMIINKCLKIYDKDISFSIAHDPKGKNIDDLTGADPRIPLVFVIGKSGKILWRGHPLELKTVLKKVLQGTFDLNKQIKLSKLQNKLQSFLQIEDIPNAIATAEKMLRVDPGNDIAMRVKLFEYESTKDFKKALMFIDQQINEHPKTATLYFIKINLMKKNNLPPSTMHETFQTIFNTFKDDHAALNQLAVVAIKDMEFGDAPLKVALEASKKSIELLINSKEDNIAELALYLSTKAQLYYMIGSLNKAIEIQKRVIKLQMRDDSEPYSQKILQYYLDALTLQKDE